MVSFMFTDTDKAFAAKAREMRAVRGWSVEALAIKAGVGKRTAYRACSGRQAISLSTAVAIARAFGTTVDEMTRPRAVAGGR